MLGGRFGRRAVPAMTPATTTRQEQTGIFMGEGMKLDGRTGLKRAIRAFQHQLFQFQPHQRHRHFGRPQPVAVVSASTPRMAHH